MQTVSLVPHPKAPPRGVRSVAVEIDWAADALRLRYLVSHDGCLKIPARQGRLDELWKTTCFEIFIREGAGPGYVEFNLAPDNAWAGYGFTGERQGMHELDLAGPEIAAQVQSDMFALAVILAPGSLAADPGLASLSAVIEEQDGTKSFWAIVHPKAEQFDFHDPGIFVLDLARLDDVGDNSLPK